MSQQTVSQDNVMDEINAVLGQMTPAPAPQGQEPPSEPQPESEPESESPEIAPEPEPQLEAEPESDSPPAVQQVPLTALQEERRKNKELRDRLAALEAPANPQAAPASAATSPGTAAPAAQTTLDPNDPDPFDQLEDDEYPDKKMQKAHDAWRQREDIRRANIVRQDQAARMEAGARTRFTAEKMGEGFDYDSVTRSSTCFLRPEDQQVIMRDPDPAARYYSVCIARNPALRELWRLRHPSAPDDTNINDQPQAPQTPKTPNPPRIPNPPVGSAPNLGEVFGPIDRSPAGVAASLDFGR